MNNYIDLEKITNSIETLSTMENLVNYVDLSEYFEDMEKLFRKLNFEHANCIRYKDSLEIVYEDIERVKRKVNELIDALKRTSSAYGGVEMLTRKDIKTLAEIYQSTPASEKLQKQLDEYNTDQKKIYAASIIQIGADQQNVTVIPPVSTEQQTPSSNKQIDTVPIGVAIGVTGIVGSLGAIAINEKKQQEKKRRRRQQTQARTGVNDFKVQVFKGDTDIPRELDAYDEYFGAPSKEEVFPYQAARLEREADRFYGNQLHDIVPKQTDLTLDDDDDDENEFDDFDE